VTKKPHSLVRPSIFGALRESTDFTRIFWALAEFHSHLQQFNRPARHVDDARELRQPDVIGSGWKADAPSEPHGGGK
jgi:hypothetical protein